MSMTSLWYLAVCLVMIGHNSAMGGGDYAPAPEPEPGNVTESSNGPTTAGPTRPTIKDTTTPYCAVPMCSVGCVIEKDPRGCEMCRCPKPVNPVSEILSCLEATLGSLPRPDGQNVLLEDVCAAQQWTSVCGLALFEEDVNFGNVVSSIQSDANFCRIGQALQAGPVQALMGRLRSEGKGVTLDASSGADLQTCMYNALATDQSRPPTDLRCSYVENLMDCFIGAFNTVSGSLPGPQAGPEVEALRQQMTNFKTSLVCAWQRDMSAAVDSALACHTSAMWLVGLVTLLTVVWRNVSL